MHIQEKEVNQDRLEANVSEQKDKEEETIDRRREESDRMQQMIKEHEEGMARDLQRIKELEQEVRRRKSAREEEEKIDFFPAWKPAQGFFGKYRRRRAIHDYGRRWETIHCG